jgi:hypothetical protein
MFYCIPNAEKTACVNCGWQWTRPDICEWPRRNCPKSPDLLPAAERLGLTLDQCQPFIQQLATWMAAGYPERTPEEQADHAAMCQVCEHYGEAVTFPTVCCNGRKCQPEQSFPPQCLAGCTNEIKQRENKPPLAVLQRIGQCPAGKWPTPNPYPSI